ncbi:hypothetical protein ACWDKQ_07380 [Saccharopolyspora sp. NPDC000995]
MAFEIGWFTASRLPIPPESTHWPIGSPTSADRLIISVAHPAERPAVPESARTGAA